MKAVRVIEGTMAPLPIANVDTDQIIPKQFLKRIDRSGFGPFLFYDWAHGASGEPSSDFVLNRKEYESARVLVTGTNFGCGSSREHAPWALQDWGFEAIIAPSFADIFKNNCAKIGLLCVTLSESEVDDLIELGASDPAASVRISVEDLTVESRNFFARFEMDEFERECLLNGWDEIALTEALADSIAEYEESRPSWMPSLKGS